MSTDKGRVQPTQTSSVGGQPPGHTRELPPIPVALEELLGMAATAPDFARLLQRDPDAAAQAAGLTLSATEKAILRAIDPAQLNRMIDGVHHQLSEPDRRSFLEQAALAVAVLVGGAAVSAVAGCGPKPQTGSANNSGPAAGGGSSMQPPPPAPDAAAPVMNRPPPEMHAPVKGIRPDRLPPKTAGIRPKKSKPPKRPRSRNRVAPRRDHPPATFGQRRDPNRPSGPPKKI